MPIFKNKILAGNQFTGVDADTGRFDPGNNGNTGSPSIQVNIHSIKFHCEGTATLVELREEDPEEAAASTLVFGGTSVGAINDFKLPYDLLPTSDGGGKGFSWPLVFTTAAMDGDGWLSIDYDFEGTPG
jgi:hypothetical protein